VTKRGRFAWLLAVALLSCGPRGEAPQGEVPRGEAPSIGPAEGPDSATVRITGPTLIAVVPHTRGYLDSNVVDADQDTTGLTSMLDDFGYYLGSTDSAFRARGIDVQWRIDPAVRWEVNGRRDSLRFTPDSGVAYIFVSPTGVRVRRGVMTNLDLLPFVDSGLARRSP
jgi:hypothetical protein